MARFYDRRRENERRGGKWLREKEVDKGVINNIWILHIISGNIVKELDGKYSMNIFVMT